MRNVESPRQLKPLYANLLRLHLPRFLITDAFDHGMIENDWDGAWNQCMEIAHRSRNVAVFLPGYTGYARDALAFMLEALSNQGRDILLAFLDKTLTAFLNWTEDKPDVSILRSPLLQAGYTEKQVASFLGAFTAGQPLALSSHDEDREATVPPKVSQVSPGSPFEELVDALDLVVQLCGRFHAVAHQLRLRHDGRETIDVNDEYDVQDLLHALLRGFFNDVRAEEYTPSYAGKATRMDFLLKQHKIVIEVKMTRKGLADKEVGDQLILDIERYRSHPHCKTLICFVYDPEGRIVNPGGLQADLSGNRKGISVIVLVVPAPY